MYGDKETSSNTMHIRHALRNEFPDLLPFDTLGGTATNEDGDGVYRPSYAEIDRAIGGLLIHESTRMFKNTSLRIDDGDQTFAPRTRKTDSLVEPDGSA